MGDPESRIRHGLQTASEAVARGVTPPDVALVTGSRHRMMATTKLKLAGVAASLVLLGGVVGGFAVTGGGGGSTTPSAAVSEPLVAGSPHVLLVVEEGALEALSPVNGAVIRQLHPSVPGVHGRLAEQLVAVAATPDDGTAYAEFVGMLDVNGSPPMPVPLTVSIVAVPLDGAPMSLVTTRSGYQLSQTSPELSPNGQYLAWVTPSGTTVITDLAQGAATSVMWHGAVSALAWSPDSRDLAVTTGAGSKAALHELSLSSGEVRTVATDSHLTSPVKALAWGPSGAIVDGGTASSGAPCWGDAATASVVSCGAGHGAASSAGAPASAWSSVYGTVDAVAVDPVTGAVAVLGTPTGTAHTRLQVVGQRPLRTGDVASPQWISEAALGANVTQQPGIPVAAAQPCTGAPSRPGVAGSGEWSPVGAGWLCCAPQPGSSSTTTSGSTVAPTPASAATTPASTVVVGSTGLTGSSGPTGTTGATGMSGISGQFAWCTGGTGVSGTSGVSGVSGVSGTSGTSGVSGTSGTSGVSGVSGVSGASGTTRSTGSTGVGVISPPVASTTTTASSRT